MRMRAAFCGLLLSFTTNVNAEKSLDWLKIVAFAAHQTDYSGVFVYQYDNRVETSRIAHVVEADGEYEKLESLDGPKRKIIRHHGQVWCNINNKMVQVDSKQVRIRFPAFLPEQISTLSENYQAERIGVARVAGYNAQVILFEPKDNLRYAHKIWAHTGSGLLLKAAVLGDKNQIIEQYTFTQLQVGEGVDRSWIKTIPPSKNVPVPPEAGGGGTPVNSGWEVGALPAGFRKTMEIQRTMRGRPTPVTQIVFSDGLSAISVFIEPDDGEGDNTGGLSSRGAVNLYHKVVGEQLFTVVGEVPARTVIQVLDSIRHKGK